MKLIIKGEENIRQYLDFKKKLDKDKAQSDYDYDYENDPKFRSFADAFLKTPKEENEELLKNKDVTQCSDSELQKEVLDRLKHFPYFPYRANFHKLKEYFRDGFIDKHMITTLSVWDFLRWKKKKKKQSVSFKLP